MRFLVPTAPVAIQGFLGLGAGGVAADELHGELAGQRPPVEVEPDEDVVELHGGSPARGRAARFSPPGDRVAATHGVRRRVKGGRTAGPKDASPLRRRRGAVGSAGRPRERPVRGRVQGPGRGAEGEAVPSLGWRGNETGADGGRACLVCADQLPQTERRVGLAGDGRWTSRIQKGERGSGLRRPSNASLPPICVRSSCTNTRPRLRSAWGVTIAPKRLGNEHGTRASSLRAGACRASPCGPPAALVRMVVEGTLGEALDPAPRGVAT